MFLVKFWLEDLDKSYKVEEHDLKTQKRIRAWLQVVRMQESQG